MLVSARWLMSISHASAFRIVAGSAAFSGHASLRDNVFTYSVVWEPSAYAAFPFALIDIHTLCVAL